jgi:hypothetical protein
MKMEAQWLLETSVNILQPERCNVPDDVDLQSCFVGGELDTWAFYACTRVFSSSVHRGEAHLQARFKSVTQLDCLVRWMQRVTAKVRNSVPVGTVSCPLRLEYLSKLLWEFQITGVGQFYPFDLSSWGVNHVSGLAPKNSSLLCSLET